MNAIGVILVLAGALGLQRALNAAGYPAGAVDGRFGEKTRDAVMNPPERDASQQSFTPVGHAGQGTSL